MFTVFPLTFKGRANGMRLDISEAESGIFPLPWRKHRDRADLEGGSTATRWTLGALTARPGRQGDWGYIHTEFVESIQFWPTSSLETTAVSNFTSEYLQWIEDMGMELIMAGSGASQLIRPTPKACTAYSLDGNSVAQASLAPSAQDAIDRAHHHPGAMHGAIGHPEPFALQYTAIGNEDFVAASTYNSYRWAVFYLSAEFSQLNFFTGGCYHFDILPRNGQQFLQREYVVTTANSGAALAFPEIDGTLCCGTYLNNSQWTPNLISFPYLSLLGVSHSFHGPTTLIKSMSCYIQQMFGVYKVECTKNTTASPICLKMVNTATVPNTVVFTLPFTILDGGCRDCADRSHGDDEHCDEPKAAVHRAITFTAGKTISYAASALSASVLIVSVH
ncbi:hypothetical protein K438DRAFT_1995543 [Mycena galopus ATCC 62051]|nr:hypothetical protein K438DRAFT_1995543 [Mycena galopus ATCC 62051]